MGAACPLESKQPRDPLSDFNGPGKPDTAGEPRARQRRPLPWQRSLHPQGSPEGCSFGPCHPVGPLGSSLSPSQSRDGVGQPQVRKEGLGRCRPGQWAKLSL